MLRTVIIYVGEVENSMLKAGKNLSETNIFSPFCRENSPFYE